MWNGVIGSAAARIDRAFARALLGRSERSRLKSAAESLGHEARMERLAEIQRAYHRDEFYTEPDSFFPTPSSHVVKQTHVAPCGANGAVVDLAWESGYQPHEPDIAEKYLAHEENRTAAARVYLHSDRPRPAVILVHGYMGGQYGVESRVWPLKWLFDRGMDAALAVLPGHGVRGRREARSRPLFPASDPRVTNEGFRQGVMDLRALVSWFEARGSRAVGAMGMSLGGYTTSLLATVEPRLAFAVPMIPLASIADAARDGNRFVGTPEQQELQYRALDDAHRIVSPLARPSRVPGDRVLIIAGENDQITPLAHARKLAEHFGAELMVWPGGHLLQFGRSEGFRAVGRMLGRLGLLE